MFSGMFTHCVKPALTVPQAKELFALLGYQSPSSDEEELKLSAKPVHPHTLLQLACGFFTARIECHLLLTSVESLDGNMECVLHLIQERKHGCTFQTALDNAKRKLESAPCDLPLALDATLDLYTDDSLAGHSQMASPPSLPYIPPSEDPLLHKISCSTASQSNKDKNEKKAPAVSISSLTCQIKAPPRKTDSNLKHRDNEKQLSVSKEGHVCNCLKSYEPYPNQCFQCREIHRIDCPCFKSCLEQGHKVSFAQEHKKEMLSKTRQDQTGLWEKPIKDYLKQHSCINKPSNDFFFVCYDCHYIHDAKCQELERCLYSKHYVQTTGRLQPAQAETMVTAHSCVKEEDTDYAVWHMCNKSHDLICNELQHCQLSGLSLHYVDENEKTSQAKPMPLHHCCISTQPSFACLTCRVFHGVSCDDNQCQRQHDVQSVEHTCCTCSETELYILCRYCCAQHCKKCWFKSPLDCKCGMPFADSAV